MKSLRPRQTLNSMPSIGLDVQKTEGSISEPLNYRRCAREVALMFVDEPREVWPLLDDLRNAIAGAGARVEKNGNELAALQNSLICLHDVLKAYEEYHFEVPKRLTAMDQRLKQRRNTLDPHSYHL